MALNKSALKTAILSIMTDMRKREQNSDDEYATRLSDSIYDFVITGEVQPGITVNTTGSAAAHTGATTGKGTIL